LQRLKGVLSPNRHVRQLSNIYLTRAIDFLNFSFSR
jgi:hypothetical protein